MSEELIIQLIPQRMIVLGYQTYHIKYRDLVVEACGSMEITAYNELYFIIGDPPGLVVSSDYGLYDSVEPQFENVHLHRGEITVSNPTTENRRIKFLQVIIVN